MIALDDDDIEWAGAPAPLDAQLRVLRQHEGVADALLVAARFRCESPAGDLWRRREELGAPLLPRHEALDAARRIADEEPGLRGFLRYLDANEEAQVLGRGWAWRRVAATGRREYSAPGAGVWVGLRRAAAICRASVLTEGNANGCDGPPDGPAVVRDPAADGEDADGYDQREREGDDFAQAPAPDDAPVLGVG